MTLKELYTAIDGDYENVVHRLYGEPRVQKFVLKFLDDKSFDTLCHSMETGNQEEAFRAAHTLKGMCQNLSFTKLEDSSSQVTEALRSGDMAGAQALMGNAVRDYNRVIDAIHAFQAGIL